MNSLVQTFSGRHSGSIPFTKLFYRQWTTSDFILARISGNIGLRAYCAESRKKALEIFLVHYLLACLQRLTLHTLTLPSIAAVELTKFLFWHAQFDRILVVGTRRKWPRPGRDRDEKLVLGTSRDRDVETKTTTLLLLAYSVRR